MSTTIYEIKGFPSEEFIRHEKRFSSLSKSVRISTEELTYYS